MWNDVEALRTIARNLQGFADSVGEAASTAQSSDPGWVSTAADDYQRRVDRATTALRTRSSEIGEASTAVFAYADAVERHIEDLKALAATLGEGLDYVWGCVQDGASDVVDFLGDRAEDAVDGIGRAVSGAVSAIKGWL